MKSNKNGVKLLAAVLVFAVALAGVAILPTFDADAASTDSTLTAAGNYKYTPEYNRVGSISISENDNVVDATYTIEQLSANGGYGVLADFARLVGALYWANGTTVTSITYDGNVYVWDPEKAAEKKGTEALIGSNWYNDSEGTLISTIFSDANLEESSFPPQKITLTVTKADKTTYVMTYKIIVSVSDATELQKALAAGAENVLIAKNIEVDISEIKANNQAGITITDSVNIDGNGKTITAVGTPGTYVNKGTDKQYATLVMAVDVNAAAVKPVVSISDLTIDAGSTATVSKSKHAITIDETNGVATTVYLTNVAAKNYYGNGFSIAGGNVIMTDCSATSPVLTNWGGINVAKTAGSTQAKLAIDSVEKVGKIYAEDSKTASIDFPEDYVAPVSVEATWVDGGETSFIGYFQDINNAADTLLDSRITLAQMSVNVDQLLTQKLKSASEVTINVAEDVELTVDLTRPEDATAFAAIEASKITIIGNGGSSFVIDVDGVTKDVISGSEYTYGFKSSGNITIRNIAVDITVGKADVYAFAIEGKDTTLTNVTGQITGGNRAIQMGANALVISGSELSISGGEKAIQAKTAGATVSVQDGSKITLKVLGDNNKTWNTGDDDRFGIKTVDLTIEKGSVVITDGIRLYTKSASLVTGGVLIVNGGYAQKQGTIAGFVNDGVQIAAYDGIAAEPKDGGVYVGNNVEVSNVTLMPLPGGSTPVVGEIVTSADEASKALENEEVTEVTIMGDADISSIDAKTGDTIVIGGTATISGELQTGVNYVINDLGSNIETSNATITVVGGTTTITATVSVSATGDLVVDGSISDATLTVNNASNGFKFIQGSVLTDVSVSYTDGNGTTQTASITMTVKSGTVSIVMGSIKVVGSADITGSEVELSAGIGAANSTADITLENVKITKASGLQEVIIQNNSKITIIGTVEIGQGVVIKAKNLELKENAVLKGAGSLEVSESVNAATGSSILCEYEVPSELTINSDADFSAENLALYDYFVLGGDIEITSNISIPAGKSIDLAGKTLAINNGKEFTITNVEIVDSSDNSTGKIKVVGTFSIDNSDVFTDVEIVGDGTVNMIKAKTKTVSGQSIGGEAVGYGNTLVLDGVTIEYNNHVKVYGKLEISGNTKIVNGASLEVSKSGSVIVKGTLNVAGDVIVKGMMDISGSVTVAGSANKNASFINYNEGGFDEDSFGVRVQKDATFTVAKPSGTTYYNLLVAGIDENSFLVEGTLNMNGFLAGDVTDRGTVRINGSAPTASASEEYGIFANVFIYDGITVEIASITGVISIDDTKATKEFGPGVIDGVSDADGGKITVSDVKGLKISEIVNSKTKDSNKFLYPDMTISGTATQVSKDVAGSIIVEKGTGTPANATSTNKRAGYITVEDTLNLGESVSLSVKTGTLVIDGLINVVEKNSSMEIDGGIVTVNGVITIGGKSNTVTAIDFTTGLNAAYYTTQDEDMVTTGFYTGFDTAMEKIDVAVEKTVYVYGSIKQTADQKVVDGQSLVIYGTLKINSDKTLSVTKNASVTVTGGVTVSGTATFDDYANAYTGNEPSADVVSINEPARIYSSLAGAIAAGSKDITLSKDVTISSNLTIPADVTVKSDKFGIKVSKNYTLTVDGAVILTSGSKTLTLDSADMTATDKQGAIVINGYVSTRADSTGLTYTDGAHFTKKVDGRVMNFVSSVEYSASAVDDSVTMIKIYGAVSAGDIVFTAKKSNLEIQVLNQMDGRNVEKYGVLAVSSMKLVSTDSATVTVNLAAANSGKITGVVTAATGIETTTGATDGIIELNSVNGITIVASKALKTEGVVDVLTLSGSIVGEVNVKAGTITAGIISTENNTTVGTLKISEDAILSITQSATLTVGVAADKKASTVVDGAIIVQDGTLTVNGIMTVAGTIDATATTIDLKGTLFVTGTITLSEEKSKEAYLKVYDGSKLIVGEKPVILGTAGSEASVAGRVNFNTDSDGYIVSYPGADLSKSKIQWNDAESRSGAISTQYMINDVVYMTVTALKDKVQAYDVIDAESFEITGLYNGVNFTDPTKDTGLYDIDSWFTDAAMSPNKKLASGDKITTDLPAVYAFADAADVYGVISVGTGLNLFIDGVPVQSGPDAKLGVGTHTVRFDVFANYDGSKAVLSFNGQVISNGSTITIGAGDKTFSLVVSGAVPSESEIIVTPGEPSQPEKDDGMGLTDILLIVLVVLAAILVVVVAIRMMRS